MAIATDVVDDQDVRDLRAATEYLYVLPIAEQMFEVYSEAGEAYTVDLREGRCTCPDAEYRDPVGGCKHRRRVELAMGQRSIPDGLSLADLDPLLADRPAVREAFRDD